MVDIMTPEECEAHQELKRRKKNAYNISYNNENKKRLNDYYKIWYETNKNALKEKRCNYRKTNQETIKEARKSYLEINKEAIKNKQSEYYKTPVGKMSLSRMAHKRRSLQNKSLCTLTPEQWISIIEEQNHICAHCKCKFTKDVKPTQDHIVPITKGGSYTYENIQALCRRCNSRKRDRFEEDLPYLQVVTSALVIERSVADMFVLPTTA